MAGSSRQARLGGLGQERRRLIDVRIGELPIRLGQQLRELGHAAPFGGAQGALQPLNRKGPQLDDLDGRGLLLEALQPLAGPTDQDGEIRGEGDAHKAQHSAPVEKFQQYSAVSPARTSTT